MISVDELRVDYGNFCAVEELSFSVAEGEVFGLIGPNGAGKSRIAFSKRGQTVFEEDRR